MAAHGEQLRQQEKWAGLALIASAILALVLANSPAADAYHHVLEWRAGPSLPRIGVPSVHQWISDALMALFFLLVGLEVKREWYDGRLSTPAERRLPMLAAAAGMAVPALVYLSIVQFDPALARGWAIPAATDIAFAIGVLALLGGRAAPALKLLLVTIAVIDDVGAVIIIALAYTATLDAAAIGIALLIAGAMAGMNLFGVRRLLPFLAASILLWLAVLASGVHPTVAGVVAALTIPLGRGEARSPLKRLERRLHPWVMFGVMPLFGLASAGVALGDGASLAAPLPLAVLAGLVLGKQAGVFGALWLADRSGLAPRPAGTSWPQLYGVALLTGIGFTMSLFIGQLAFPGDAARIEAARLGTLAGSLLAGLAGWAVLRFAAPVAPDPEDAAEAEEIFGCDQPEDS